MQSQRLFKTAVAACFVLAAIIAAPVVQAAPHAAAMPNAKRLAITSFAVDQAAFASGLAGRFSPKEMEHAGVFVDDRINRGFFKRRHTIKYIILHSTETAHIADARRVIASWNNCGHGVGAQFVVDRDGTIYQTVNPDLGSHHVDGAKTLFGVKNDNSIGIEIVRSGGQKYTDRQLASVVRLDAYLQSRYKIADDHVLGHGQVQPADRTDPVGFDWRAFENLRARIATKGLS